MGKWEQQGTNIWFDHECRRLGQGCGGIQFDAKSQFLRRMNKYFLWGGLNELGCENDLNNQPLRIAQALKGCGLGGK